VALINANKELPPKIWEGKGNGIQYIQKLCCENFLYQCKRKFIVAENPNPSAFEMIPDLIYNLEYY
jgi:hypothetical protein